MQILKAEEYNLVNYSLEEARKIIAVRYGLVQNGYTAMRPYIISENIRSFEIIRLIYKYFTIIFSIIALIIYIFSIKNLFNRNMFVASLILIAYLIIILGISITNVTGFYAIRYYYLGNIYILQNVFIILSLNIFLDRKYLRKIPSKN